MDTLSHALWGRGVFGYKGRPYVSLFFGAFPDLFSFGIYFLFNFFFNTSNLKFGKPELDELPKYIFTLYDFTHSLIIALFFILIVYCCFNKNLAFAMLAWPLHILIDFPFHSVDYFPTPIFWPICDFKFNGVPWSNKYVFFSNLAGIFLLYFYRYKRSTFSKNQTKIKKND